MPSIEIITGNLIDNFDFEKKELYFSSLIIICLLLRKTESNQGC